MGCILYELAAGKKAFDNDSNVIMHHLKATRFMACLAHAPYDMNVKTRISSTVLHMLHDEPKSRPKAADLQDTFAGHFHTSSQDQRIVPQIRIEDADTQSVAQLASIGKI